MEEKSKEFRKLLKDALKEMEKNQTVLLIRGDKIQEGDLPLYCKMYKALQEVKEQLEAGIDLQQMIRHKNMNIFFKHESFFMDLFETHCFNKLFDLFEYE